MQHAGTSTSGPSVGITQFDFAVPAHTKERTEALIEAEKSGIISESGMKTLTAELSTQGNKAFLSSDIGQKFQDFLNTKPGREMVNRLDAAQISKTIDHLKTAIETIRASDLYITNADHRNFIESKSLQLTLADIDNQTGGITDMTRLLSGEKTQLVKDLDGVSLQLEKGKAATMETMIEAMGLFGETQKSEEHAASQLGRYERMQKFQVDEGIITQKELKVNVDAIHKHVRHSNNLDLTGKVVVKAGDSLWEIGRKYGVSVDAIKDANPQIGANNIIKPGEAYDLPEGAVTATSVYAAYARQGIPQDEADQHWEGLAKSYQNGATLAAQGLTVREASVINDVAKGLDARGQGYSGPEMAAATRYRSALERTNGDHDAAMQYAKEGLAEARTYNGPSQEFSPGDQPFSAKDIKTYMDSIRDSVTVPLKQNKQAAITSGNLLASNESQFGSESIQVASNSTIGLLDVAPAQPQAARPNSITVKAGETLSEIAFKNYTTVNDLMFDNPHIRDANWIHAGDVINVSNRANIAPATPRNVPSLAPRKPAPQTKAPKIVGLPGYRESTITSGARDQVQEIEHTAKVLAQGQPVTQAQAAPERDTITVEDANLTNFAKRHGTTACAPIECRP